MRRCDYCGAPGRGEPVCRYCGMAVVVARAAHVASRPAVAVARLHHTVPSARVAALVFGIGWAVVFAVLWAWSAIAPPAGIG